MRDDRGQTGGLRLRGFPVRNNTRGRLFVTEVPVPLWLIVASAALGVMLFVWPQALTGLGLPPILPRLLATLLTFAGGMGLIFSLAGRLALYKRSIRLQGFSMAEMIVARRREHGRCGMCDYALDGLHPDSDGCTVCPECGAAWRIPKKSFEDHGSA